MWFSRGWLLAPLLALVLAEDFYNILGVGKDATEREIKKAYRALSRQYHPDKNKGNEEAQQKFIEIANAYEVLSDKDERAKYDRYGEAGLKGGHHQDPRDMFSHFFGGNRGFGGFGGGNQRARGQNAMTHLEASLVDTYKGSTLEFSVNMQSICDECDGSGSSDGQRVTCNHCQGRGQIIMEHQLAPGMVQRIQMPCNHCGGRGSAIKSPCKACKGSRVMREDRKYNVFLDAGAPREWDYVLDGEGDQSPDWEAGNLIVRVHESPDNNYGYRRRGANLFREEVLSSKQAAQGGWSRDILQLDLDSHIRLSREKGQRVYDGELEIRKGEGMPHQGQSDTFGDLYIRYVVIPSHSKGHDEL